MTLMREFYIGIIDVLHGYQNSMSPGKLWSCGLHSPHIYTCTSQCKARRFLNLAWWDYQELLCFDK